MFGDAAILARMYPSMAAAPSTTESTARVTTGVATQADSASAGTVAPRPAGDAVFKQSHPHDVAARMYPNQEPPAGSDAAKAKAEVQPTKAPVEVVPENIAKLRADDPNAAAGRMYTTHYDQALTTIPAESTFVRQFVSGMAHDVGMAPGDLETIANIAHATTAGNVAQTTEVVSDADKTDAYALMGRDPRVSQIMDKLNLSSHPRVIAIFANLAREQRSRGRL